MSNIKGINFAQQRLLPSDFGRLLRPIYKDGSIFGCKLSALGQTLTMAPGILFVGGKGLRLDAPEEWIINGGNSGYARVLLTIDLSRSATKDVFDQVQTTIEYAVSYDGFIPLQQGDINGSDSIYQAVLAVVQLSERGIESIVQQLPEACNLHPVGSVYISADATSPAQLFGGDWMQIKDTFILAAGDKYHAGTTGGEAEHTLSIAEIPSHDHSNDGSNKSGTFGLADKNGQAGDGWGLQWSHLSTRTDLDIKLAQNGGNWPHNNMPPFLAVYVWQRIA